jgi:hypothetical protein
MSGDAGIKLKQKKPTVFCGLECVGRKSNGGSHTGLGRTKYKLKSLIIAKKIALCVYEYAKRRKMY